MNRNQAEQAARALERHWHQRGHRDVAAHVVREDWVAGMDCPGWGVRSNLLNGLPPSMANLKKEPIR